MTQLLKPILICLALAALPAVASAGWMGFRNDLNHAIVVQTYTEARDGVRYGTPHRLYPGETTWEWVSDQSSRKLIITDTQSPRSTLLKGAEVSVSKDDVLLSVAETCPKSGAKAVQVQKSWEGNRQPGKGK
jgi:hypothetical protein